MGNLTFSSFCILVFSIMLGSVGQICLKLGMSTHTSSGESSFMSVYCRPYILIGLGIYAISTLTWMLVISRVRLSIAYPMISLSYILVVLLSIFVLHEKVNLFYASFALLCIGIGVSFIGFGLGSMKKQSNETENVE